MKKGITIACMSLFSCICMADDVPGMVIEKTDGTNVSIGISELQSVKFKDGVMLINNKNGGQQTVSVDDVKSITFKSITSAIEAITGNDNGDSITVTDLSGKVIYKGIAKDVNTMDSLHGIFIITTNGRSQKVVIE